MPSTIAVRRTQPGTWAGFVGSAPGHFRRGATWRSKPSTYAICTLDEVILPERQRSMAAHATSVVEWDAGHCPMVSRPDLIADLLIALAK